MERRVIMPLLHLRVTAKEPSDELRDQSDYWDTLVRKITWDVVPRIGETLMLPVVVNGTSILFDEKVERVIHWVIDNEIALMFTLEAAEYLTVLGDPNWKKEDLPVPE